MTRLRFLACVVAFGLCCATPLRAEEPRPFVVGSMAKIAKQEKNRPVAVVLWSLTCAPCIAEMPIWSKMQSKYPNLRLVFVSTDDITDSDRIQNLLKRHGLQSVESWAFADSFVERLRYDIDKNWNGELPRTYLSQPGKKDFRPITGMISEDDLNAWLAKHS